MKRDTLAHMIALMLTVLLLSCQMSTAQESSRSSAPGQTGDMLRLEPGKPLEGKLKGGETQRYQVELESAQFLSVVVDQRGVDVVVRVFAPNGEKLAEVDSPNGTEGSEPVAFEAKQTGFYRLEVSAPDAAAAEGRYEIKIVELLTAAQYKVRQAEERAQREAVVKWLKESAIPLRSVTAGSGFADLQPLKHILKDVRVVGLGEATHGAREFFQFKHRMLEFLVREMGFRVFAIEASYAACFNINEYVMGRTDDGAKALDSQGFWTWNTAEVRAMLDWMRAYNKSVPAERRVKFVGFDIQGNERGREVVLAYLRKVAPERVAAYEALPKPVRADGKDIEISLEALTRAVSGGPKEGKEAAVAKLNEIRNRYDELLGFMLLNETKFTRQTSATEFADALQHARVIAQYLDAYGTPPKSQRDFYMAENIERLVKEEPAGTRFVIWAHNGHISTGDNDGVMFQNMGWFLRKAFGDAYYALGFSFNQGMFQARNGDPQARVRMALTAFKVGAAPEGSVDWYLAQTGIKNFIVDLRPARKNKVAAEWLNAPRPMRDVGSVYSTSSEAEFYVTPKLGQEFDGLVFFDTTTRAQPNPSVANVAMGQ
jgi:erythromycin esterase